MTTEGKFMPRFTKDLEMCRNSNKPLVIIPGGQQAAGFYNYLKKHNIEIEFFIDNDPKKHGTLLNNIPVISFTDFKSVSSEKQVIVATNEHIEKIITKQLEDNNITNYKCITAEYLCYTVDEIENAGEIIVNNLEPYFKLYSMMADELSRKTLINRLNYLITYDNKYLKEIVRPPENQYFEPSIYKVTAEDYFVDCGAFDGDTLKQLMTYTDSKIAGYRGFEPDDINYSKLKEKAQYYDNVAVFKKGVFKENTVLKFNSVNNSASQLNQEGNIEIEVVSLDNTIGDEKISFIKMDIEGAEYDALSGAINIIQKQKPVLAICAYHKFDDIYKLAFLIESFGVNYKFYLRHYTLGAIESVLYAVPK